MKANQQLKNNKGNEIFLFPLDNMYLTPARDPAEHEVLALDFLGWNGERIYNCPCYAPFSCKVVYAGNDHNMICWSDEEVEFADGTIDYASVLVAHSNLDIPYVNQTFKQGDLWYHTGNYGMSTGDHLHIEIAKGHNLWNDDGIGLKNAIHCWLGMYVNDTILFRTGDFDWKIYEGGITPINPKKRKKFKWVLYTKNLRN